MPQFNATDAIFFGFRVIQRDPLLMLTLAALFAILSVASALLTSESAAELNAATLAFETRMQEIQGSAQTDPEQAATELFAAYGELGAALADFLMTPSVLALIMVSLLLALAARGAILRALVHDRREGWVMGLQIGGDELRILVVSIVVNLLVALAWVAACLVLLLVVALFSAVSPALGFLLGFVGIIACGLAVALVGVRFGAAAAASVGEKKFVVFGSWQITKGRMWGLLGAYVILVFLAIAASLLVFGVGAVVAPGAMGMAQGMTAPESVEEMSAAYQSPGYLFVSLLIAVLNVAFTAGWAGVGAYAYRMLGAAVGYPNAHPPEAGPPVSRATP